MSEVSKVPDPISPQVEAPKLETSEIPKVPVESNGVLNESDGIWIKKLNEIEVIIYCLRSSEGKFQGFIANPLSNEYKETTGVKEHPIKAVFSLPNRKQIQRYRERSGRWVEAAQSQLTDRNQVRVFFLKNHLLRIDLKHPETNLPIEVKRDEEGRLTEETEALFDTIHPSLLEMLLAKFERVADLVY